MDGKGVGHVRPGWPAFYFSPFTKPKKKILSVFPRFTLTHTHAQEDHSAAPLNNQLDSYPNTLWKTLKSALEIKTRTRPLNRPHSPSRTTERKSALTTCWWTTTIAICNLYLQDFLALHAAGFVHWSTGSNWTKPLGFRQHLLCHHLRWQWGLAVDCMQCIDYSLRRIQYIVLFSIWLLTCV